MIRLEKVSKYFHLGTVNETQALCEVDFEIHEGDFISVIGGNGAGKSTLLNVIAGVFGIESGSIYLDDKDIAKMPEHRRAAYFARVFQDPLMGTAGNMMIRENLALAAMRGQRFGLRTLLRRSDEAHFRELLKRLDLGLEDRLDSKVGLLSGGQRQALALLMAGMQSPRLLLLDEHTAALDPQTAKKIMDETDRLVSETKTSTLMITHNMKHALEYGNRLIMMYKGRILFDLKGEEKKNLTIQDLMQLFQEASGEVLASDRMLLQN
ncbi:MAG: ATP-binding cassette domain-containing protein [Eubacteriales bacterium]|nr:ATP-binding cassette domain-containing protein [Eubacteriales bacterium]